MAADDRRPRRSVADRLFEEPHAFEFAQAVMLLERMRPRATSLGTGVDPRAEALRLRGPLSPVFAPSEVTRLERGGEDQQPVLTAQLFGLGGPDGPLPYAYQEWLQQRALRKDHGPAEFLDLFHNRLLALLYRAQLKYRVAPAFASPSDSPAQPVLRALVGLLPRPLQNRQAIPDAALLARTGLIANERRSLAGFRLLVRHHFGVPVEIAPFEGDWRPIPEASLSRLGRSGRNRVLGRDAVAGKRIWDEHAGIRIELGPLSLDSYRDYLPDGASHKALAALAAFYFGPDLSCSLVLRLAEEQAPRATLDRGTPAKLGWTSWFGQNQGEAPARVLKIPLRTMPETAS